MEAAVSQVLAEAVEQKSAEGEVPWLQWAALHLVASPSVGSQAQVVELPVVQDA